MNGMTTLIEQQHALAHAVTDVETSEAVHGTLLADHRQRGALGLRIYRHAYVARLTEALAANHPILQRAMGDAPFNDLARRYIARHPSTHPSIRWFGHRLAEFIQEKEQGGADWHPALADLARAEWAIAGAYDASDAMLLTFDDLAAVPPEAWPAMCFAMHPSVHLVALQWNIEIVLRALARDQDATLPEPELLSHTLLVWRSGLEVQWRALDDVERGLLLRLRDGCNFEMLCVQAAQQVDEDQTAVAVAGWLRRWIDEGLLSSSTSSSD